ncbi:MAG TPA: hypothetical protein VIY49_24295 [Bryobacteraceae bacterium]
MRDELIDAALRQAPEAPVPANFRNRLLARLPEPIPQAPYDWVRPAIWFAGTATIAPFAIFAVKSGLLGWLETPAVTVTAALIEAALSLLWFRRIRQ